MRPPARCAAGRRRCKPLITIRRAGGAARDAADTRDAIDILPPGHTRARTAASAEDAHARYHAFHDA